MVQENKTALVQTEIERLIDKGQNDLQQIYTIVCDKYGVQRPAARRAKKQLLAKLNHRVKVLGVAGGRSSIPKGRPVNFTKLSPTEQRVLKFLKDKNDEMKFRTIHDHLNSISDQPLVKKDRLTYCLSRLCAANLVTMIRESRYRINKEVCNSLGVFNKLNWSYKP